MKLMQKQNWLLLFLAMAINFTAIAQKTEIYTNDLKEYNRAVELYKEKQYQSAQIIFKNVKEQINNY